MQQLRYASLSIFLGLRWDFDGCGLKLLFRRLARPRRSPCATALHYIDYNQSRMLKEVQKDQFLYNEKPRKRVKLNHCEDENYNQFKGEGMEIEERANDQGRYVQEEEVKVAFKDYQEESTRNSNIFDFIRSSGRKIRSIKDASIQQVPISQPKEQQKGLIEQQKISKKVPETNAAKGDVKKEENQPTEVKIEQPSKAAASKPKKAAKPEATGMSNWAKFMSTSQPKQAQHDKSKPKKPKTEMVAMDCEFVKSGQEELLGRVSIVSETGDCLLDTYVRPDKKVTDFVTEISGITFAHIRNAPSTKQVIEKVKKTLYGHILVGHTIWKDIEVCGLKQWKGCKAIVDISEYEPFKEKNGKLISLKNLSARHLGKKIQDGRHSSVEDAEATIALFNLKKKEILKQFRVIL